MPMAPSFFVAAIYGGLKVTGYAGVAAVINKFSHENYSPVKFGLLKTGFGFLGGLLSMFIISSSSAGYEITDQQLLLLVLPIRLLIWFSIIGYCYKLYSRRSLLLLSCFGTACSYILDFAMVIIFGILPGMEIPWC